MKNEKTINNPLDFLKDIFDEEDILYINRLSDKGMKNEKYTLKNIDQDKINRLSYLNQKFKHHIYYSVSSYKKDEDGEFHRRKANVKEVKRLFFDIDDIEHCEEQHQNAIKHIGEPSYIIESSPGKKQLIYKLKEGVQDIEDFEAVQRVYRDLIGSDKSVKTSQQILRMPFFKNVKEKYKNEKGEFPESKLLEHNKVTYDFNELKKGISVQLEEEKKKRKKHGTSAKIDRKSKVDIEHREINFNNIKLYKSLNRKIKSFRNTDFTYSKLRAKNEKDFMTVFNEITRFRSSLGNEFEKTSLNVEEHYRFCKALYDKEIEAIQKKKENAKTSKLKRVANRELPQEVIDQIDKYVNNEVELKQNCTIQEGYSPTA